MNNYVIGLAVGLAANDNSTVSVGQFLLIGGICVVLTGIIIYLFND